MRQENEILLERSNDITFFDILGDVTVHSDTFLKEAYVRACEFGTNKIILNFEETAYINSAGISILIQMLANAKKNNQIVGVSGLSNHFRKIFNMVGITKFADLYDTRQDAMERMQ